MAIALRRDGGLRRPQAQGAGGREPQAEEALAETMLDASALKEMLGKTSNAQLAETCCDLGGPREKNYSQRRACRLVGLHPKTYRYVTKRSGDEALRGRLRELASQRRRPSPPPVVEESRSPGRVALLHVGQFQ
jgi:putative transposase